MTMTKTKVRAARATKLDYVGTYHFYATPAGVRFGSARSPVYPPATAFKALSKSEARAVRKSLRRAGYPAHAAVRRAN